MKNVVRMICALCCAVGLFGMHAPMADAKTTIKLAHMLNQGNSMYDSLAYFGKTAEELSKGEIKVQIYPGAQLGSDIATIEAVLNKQIEMAAIGNMNISVYTDEFLWTNLPYIFKDAEGLQKVLDSKFLAESIKKVEDSSNLKILFAVNSAGPIYPWFAKKQIRVPADMKGMKIRSTASPVQQDLIRALGANPTPVAWPEVYMAIEQGVAEGLICDYLWIYSAKLEEVNKHVTDMAAVMMPTFVLIGMNKEVFYSYPENVQKVIVEAGQMAQQFSHKAGRDAAAAQLEYGRKAGVNIYNPTPEESEKWVEAGRSIWPKHTAGMSQEFLDAVIKFQE